MSEKIPSEHDGLPFQDSPHWSREASLGWHESRMSSAHLWRLVVEDGHGFMIAHPPVTGDPVMDVPQAAKTAILTLMRLQISLTVGDIKKVINEFQHE